MASGRGQLLLFMKDSFARAYCSPKMQACKNSTVIGESVVVGEGREEALLLVVAAAVKVLDVCFVSASINRAKT